MVRLSYRTVVLLAAVFVTFAATLAGSGVASDKRLAAAAKVTTNFAVLLSVPDGDSLKFKISVATVKRGTIDFTLVNKSTLPHDFKIAGKKTPRVSPGKSAKLTVTLKAGKFRYICTVKGHAAAGMKGILTVT